MTADEKQTNPAAHTAAQKNANQYPLPCMIRSKMNPALRGLCLSMYFLLTFTLLLPWIKVLFPAGSARVIPLHTWFNFDTLFFFVLSLLFLSYWLYMDVFRKAYIFMDESGMQLKFFLRRSKKIPWVQIGLADMVQPERVGRHFSGYKKARVGRGAGIRIILRDSGGCRKKTKRFPKTFVISFGDFSELDGYRFLNTVGEQMEKASK